ncbi:MAG: DsrE/DsrF/DrsH-like family protein [Sedimentisphaerales bacterium]|nr:DsrE/DsrF/DrsH-like family protein [Sedimentisphaerales bacterium]
MTNSQAAAIDPALLSYIDKTVTAKVAEQIETARQKGEQAVCKEERPDTTAISNRATLVVFSGDMDKLLASFVIATGAALMGMKVSMYFAFWGLMVLKKKTVFRNKSIAEKLMALMLPAGPDNMATSKMNLMGMGPAFFRYAMKKKHISTLPELMNLAREMGVRMIACQMSMDVMGIKKEELLNGLDYGGVATYLADARDSRITLFI